MVITKMESESIDRIPWGRQYYCDITTPETFFKFLKCLCCGITFLDDRTEIPNISHLNKVHRITELTHHPERVLFKQKFFINTAKSIAKCRSCARKKIVYNQYGLYLLKNHVEIYHKENLQTYELITKTKGGRDILDKYFIIGNEALCLKCDRKIDMTHSKTQPAEKVKELLEHYFSHRSYAYVHIRRANIVYTNRIVREIKNEHRIRIKYELYKQKLHLKEENKLLCTRASDVDEIAESGRTVLNEPGPSTSNSTADDRTERSEQNGVPQNIPSKRCKSSTLDETQKKKRKEKE